MANFDPNAAAKYGAYTDWLIERFPFGINKITTAVGSITDTFRQDGVDRNEARVIYSFDKANNFTVSYTLSKNTASESFTQRPSPIDLTFLPVEASVAIDTTKSRVVENTIDVADLAGSGTAAYKFRFNPDDNTKSIQWTWEEGADLKVGTVNSVGSEQSTGGSSSLTVGVSASGKFAGLGLETSVQAALEREWSKVEKVDFSKSTEQTVSKKSAITFTFNPNQAVKIGNKYF